jgi:two-component system cell cycle sensor histidine kinase/response regulator CckA
MSHPSMSLDVPTGDLVTLIHALPNPTAVCSVADGCVLATNEHFCKVLALPDEESSQLLCKGVTNAENGQNPFRVRIINESIAHFISPSGTRGLVDADVKTVQLGGKECWLIVPAAETWQNTPEQRNYETGHYRALLENLNEIIYANDKNANVAYISPNINRLAGYEAHEVIGKSFTEFVHPDDLEGRIEVFLKILSGEEQATEYRMITKTGEIKWARTNARPILRDGEVVGVQGALVDITDRKEVEEALRLSEEKYRNVVQNSKDAIFVAQGHYLKFMNPSASAILGYTCESISDRPFLEFVHPDDREMITDRYRRRLAGESLSDSIIFRIINRAGDIKDVELNAVVITWEGKPAVLNFLRDITVQKKMESQLRNAQKMEALGTLSGGIAHNFNNLLMGISGNASLSLADLTPSTIAYKHLEKIVNLVQSGSKLTRQLLEYARDGACEMVTVDINQLVKEASETLSATKKQIQIRFKPSKDVHCIKADQGQIEQVLLNLLLNAADAMPDGGDVFIETACLKGARAEGKVTLSKSMEYIMVKVSDSGTGISKKILDRIFEPFFTTKGLGRGTGLGLSTAYGIVKNHDGDICVESEVGKGSTFFIYLPAFSADGTCPAATLESPKIACYGTILLVDDEPNVLHPSATLLERSGFTVSKAISGSIAMEMFQKDWENIDLVILDLILPDVSGKDLYYRFKEINPQVRVLISSGYGQAGQAEELIANGCLGFIQKPYNITELSTLMMEIISAECRQR